MGLYSKINKANFERILKNKGYAYFTNGAYNMNIIGVRSNERVNNNTFDDFIIVEYKNSDGNKCRHIFTATTNPGVSSLRNPINSSGCAILVPNQYRSTWSFGLHKGKYKALVQCRPVKVYRDNNKNNVLDYDVPIDSGMFGINIHKAGTNSKLVDNWSAGCQVFAKSSDFNTFMSIISMQEHCGLGNKFTYTLLDEKDLD